MRCLPFAALSAGRVGELSTHVLAIAKVIGVGLLVSGCASSYASYDTPSNVGAWAPARVAVAAPPKVVEIEDDGLAVQAPPRIRKYAEPDDPSEPFSPNYGPGPASDEPDKLDHRLAKPPRQAAAPLRFRSRVTPMSSREANDIMVRAMVAHEMRNQ